LYLFTSCDRQLHDPGRATTGPQAKYGKSHRQAEAARTSAAGVDEENFAALFDRGLVRVAGNYGGEARGGRIEIELREVVKNIDRVSTAAPVSAE
jgi:hypothetical protein